MKYILMHYRNQGATVLARESDGLILGSIQVNRLIVMVNGDPSVATVRLYLDNSYALRALRELATDATEFDEREGDSRVEVAMSMPPVGRGNH